MKNFNAEMIEKAKAAISNGADAIMDLSTGGDIVSMRREILKLNIEAGEMEALLLGEQLVQLRIAQPDEAHILVYI